MRLVMMHTRPLNQMRHALGEHQLKWKSLGRIQSSIQYRLAQGDIDEHQATYYSNHRLRWIFGEMGRGVQAFTRALHRGLFSIWKRLLQFDFLKIARSGWRFLSSQKYREEFVHRYLDRGIEHWEKRGQLSDEDAQILRAQIGSPDSSVYITDFGIHIAIKPAIKAIQYWALPRLVCLRFARRADNGPSDTYGWCPGALNVYVMANYSINQSR